MIVCSIWHTSIPDFDITFKFATKILVFVQVGSYHDLSAAAVIIRPLSMLMIHYAEPPWQT
jgi:hypothetical protein